MDWERDDIRWLFVTCLIIITMIIYFYRTVKKNKIDRDVGDGMATMDLGKLWKWIGIGVIVLAAIVYEIFNR